MLPIKKKRASTLISAVLAYYETGDERLLNPVFEALLPAIKRFISSRETFCPQQRADVAQNTLIDLLHTFRNRAFLDPKTLDTSREIHDGVLWGWTRNVAKYAIGASKRRWAYAPSSPAPVEDPFMLLRESPDPDLEIEESEVGIYQEQAASMLTKVTKAIMELRPDFRQALVLVYYKGMQHEEAAALVGITRLNLTKRIGRALECLNADINISRLHPAAELYAALSSVDTGTLFHDRLLKPRGEPTPNSRTKNKVLQIQTQAATAA